MKGLILFTGILLSLISNHAVAMESPNGNCDTFSPITFGILPFVSAKQLVIRFTPLVDYLSHALNAKVRIETAPNLAEFSRRTTQNKRYDILFTAPHFYPPARKVGYQLIASVDSPGMRAVIVVPKQSQIKTIQDLRGKRMATVGKKSLVTLLIKKHLAKQGINLNHDLTIVSTPTHNASLLSSYHGVTDASALMQPPYNTASQQVKNNMRIISTTEQAPHIPMSVGDRINKTCTDKITQALLTMHTNDNGQRVLKHNHFPRFKKTTEDGYEKFYTSITQ